MVDLIEAGYRLGLIHQAVAPEASWETAWRVARERPMTDVDHAAVKFLKSKGAAYFRPVLDGAAADTVKRLTWHQEIAQARVLGSVTGTTPELYGRRIGPERLSGLMADLTGRRVDRGDGNLIWSGGSWARDWRRVARTELQFASNYGHLIDQLQRHPVNSGELPAGEVAPEVAGHFQVGDEQLAVPKALVYKVPQQVRRDEAGRLLAPCTDCHRIWYADDETPRLYPLMDVINAGENFGRAAADWQATVGPTHPNCVCGQLRSYDPVARNLFPGFNKQIEKLRGQDFEGVD